MNRYIILFLFLILFSIYLNADFVIAQNYQSANAEPSATPPVTTNAAPEVKSLTLDKTTVKLPCPPYEKNSACADGMTINVSTKISDAENDVVVYHYKVTGGIIIGTGANVVWDLNGVRAGIYKITAVADDGYGEVFRGIAKTAEVFVSECDGCGGDCLDCPTLSVSVSKKEYQYDDKLIFTANAVGGANEATYKWTVEGGAIIKGQETAQIEVVPLKRTRSFKKIKATVELGNMCEFCSPVSAFAEATRMSLANIPPDVEDIILDKEFVYLRCSKEFKVGCTEAEKIIKVKTVAKDNENDVLVYSYTVSGGRIIGQGANIIWDLAGVRFGEYTITADVDDGCGLCGKTVTKTIKVIECDNCGTAECECPDVSVLGPSKVVEIYDIVEFKANVGGGGYEFVTYKWMVEGGEIIEGQGTPKIKVKVLSYKLTATVELGSICKLCPPTSASENIAIP